MAVPELSFCGFHPLEDGIAVDLEKVWSIIDFPTPATLSSLKSFMIMVNQLAEFSPNTSVTTLSLHLLMSLKRTFTWTLDHDKASQEVKEALAHPLS